MLDHLRFQFGGYLGYVTVHIHTAQGQVVYSSSSYPEGVFSAEQTLSPEASAAWLSALGKLRIGSWRAHYAPSGQGDAAQAEQIRWELDYQAAGGKPRRIRGENAFPKRWQEFLLLMDQLYPFLNPQQIDRLTIHYYHRIQPPDAEETESAPWESAEYLVIERESGSVTHSLQIGNDCTLSHTYTMQSDVRALLDRFGEYNLLEEDFSDPSPQPDDGTETRRYVLRVEYHNHHTRQLTGYYDRCGLPPEWLQIADDIDSFLSFYEIRDMLHPYSYRMGRPRPDERIYLPVRFSPNGKSYYYRTSRTDLRPGDRVVVPAGVQNKEKLAEIIDVSYLTADALPLPLDETKLVLRRADEVAAVARSGLPIEKLLYEQESYDILHIRILEQHKSYTMRQLSAAVYGLRHDVSRLEIKRLLQEVRPELAALDARKPWLKYLSAGRHYAFELFLSPPHSWDLYGSRYLWAHCARALSRYALPMSEERFAALYQKCFARLNIPWGTDEVVFLEGFAHHNMGNGRVRGRFGADTLPLLLRRLRKFQALLDEIA